MPWNLTLPPAEYFTTDTRNLDGLIRQVQDLKVLSIDTETDGLTLHKCIPYYWSISFTESNGLDRRITLNAQVLKHFKTSFSDYDKSWVLANAKFDCHMLENFGSPIKGHLIDTAVMHALLYEEESHGLKDMARTILGWKWTDFVGTFGSLRSKTCMCGGTEASHNNKAGVCKKTGCSNFIQTSPLLLLRKAERENINLLVDYAANDAYGTWHLYKELDKQLEAATTWSLYDKTWPFIRTMKDYFYKTEVPFTRCLYICERNGLKVDKEYLTGLAPTVLKEMADIRFKINHLTGELINPKSKDQLIEFFCVKHGIKPRKLTKGGKSGKKKPSMDEKFLEWVADEYAGTLVGETAALVSEHEKINKQYGTYIEKMPGRLDRNDRVHPRLNQDIARTGRLSSSDPNLQNVTGGEKDRFKLRNAFIAEKGHSLVVADYSALEMRLLAAGSQEPAMMEIFHKNWDIHMGNASLVFGIPYDDLKAAKKIDKLVKEGGLPDSALTDYVLQCLKARGDAKTIGFGLNYGMKEKTLARRMGCSPEEALAKIDQYMLTYPAVRRFFEAEAALAERVGYSFTMLGRRRYLPDMRATDNFTRYRAQRQSSNFPIQGCLPASTRVLTKAGYIPIGEINDTGWVWTGKTWAPYEKLDRGSCELAELHLNNGQILRCDTRHKVLVLADGEYDFRSYSSLTTGDLVCLSIARPLNYGPSSGVKDWYWAGFCIGNGSTDKRDGRATVAVFIGDRKGRYDRREKTEELVNYLTEKGLEHRVDESPGGRKMNTVHITGFQKVLRKLGYPLKANGPTKTVPRKLWYLGLACRKAFVLGLLDADGTVGVADSTCPNLHMSSEKLLREVQILLRTMGVESKLRQTTERAWKLDLHGAQAAEHLGYGKLRKVARVPDMPCSAFTLSVITSEYYKPVTASHKAIRSKVAGGGQTSVYTARDMLGDFIEQYAVYALTKKVELGVTETTYTLSVDHPSHRFDSEGVISKNTAAEVCKMAMIYISEDYELRDKYGYRMCLQVHDEIVGECPDETVPMCEDRVREWMEHPFPTDIGVPLLAEIGHGKTWGNSK